MIADTSRAVDRGQPMATKFTFSLESVLALKRRREQQLQEDLAAAIQQERQARERLAGLARQRGDCLATLAARQSARLLDLASLLHTDAYLKQLEERIEAQAQCVQDAAIAVANAQDRLAAATKEMRAIEKLRETRLTEFRRRLDRQEEQRLGELALQGHVRQKRGVA